ncbi:hypothetical protein ACFR9U_15945 [Halorientalis brevis]|uniref:Uncharacterized protein n=1 Tax=Halorientalis brevis TaxID=1126241 RepID=A0ABD6CEV0_9EURY|nr:hypothetical protein [Halorientalis brevis]
MLFDEPTYLIQFGYSGQTLVKRAMEGDYADGVIMSPSDYEYGDTKSLGRDVNRQDGIVLFDPQYYIPRTERPASDTYPYFQDSGGNDFETVVVTNPQNRRELCEKIWEVQNEIDVDAYIAPARFLDTFSDSKLYRWQLLTKTFLKVVEDNDPDSQVFASLPVDGASIKDDEQRTKLLDYITKIDLAGFYVSVQYPRYRRNPLFGMEQVKSYLDLLKNLRYNWYDIILGHSDQIAHLAFGLGINAFASGHYKNTRAFDTDRWIPQDNGGGSAGVYWYYSDPLMEEMQVEQDLQALYSNGFSLDKLRIKNPTSPFEQELFNGEPEDAEWTYKNDSWDHYIWSCHQIAKEYTGLTLDERVDLVKQNLRNAAEVYSDVEEAVGPRENIQSDIYQDWMTAFDLTLSKRDMNVIKRVMP